MILRTKTVARFDDDNHTCIPLQWSYNISDPFAITFTFISDDDRISWTISRDLLALGLVERAGDGDVTIWPGARTDDPLNIKLCGYDSNGNLGSETFTTSRAVAGLFLAATRRHVEVGQETLDVDALLAEIFA